MPTVVRSGAIRLTIQFSDTMRHKAPHVHVWVSGESVASVSLLTQRCLAGGPVDRTVRQLILDNLDLLWEEWESCNA